MFELFWPYKESQWNPETMSHAIDFHCMGNNTFVFVLLNRRKSGKKPDQCYFSIILNTFIVYSYCEKGF